jgi:hypothetical protein
MGTQDDLQRAREGDPEANDSVAIRMQTVIEQVVARPRWERLRRLESRDDLIQKVTIVAWQLLPKFQYQGTGSLEAVVWKIADYALHDVEKLANAKKCKPGQNAHADDEKVLEAHQR